MKNLTEEFAKLEAANKKLRSEKRKITRERNAFRIENERLQGDLENAMDSAERINRDLETLKEFNEEITSQIEAKRIKLENRQQTIQELRDDNRNNLIRIHELERQVSLLKHECSVTLDDLNAEKVKSNLYMQEKVKLEAESQKCKHFLEESRLIIANAIKT